LSESGKSLTLVVCGKDHLQLVKTAASERPIVTSMSSTFGAILSDFRESSTRQLTRLPTPATSANHLEVAARPVAFSNFSNADSGCSVFHFWEFGSRPDPETVSQYIHPIGIG
jgi:hypothetical protein